MEITIFLYACLIVDFDFLIGVYLDLDFLGAIDFKQVLFGNAIIFKAIIIEFFILRYTIVTQMNRKQELALLKHVQNCQYLLLLKVHPRKVDMIDELGYLKKLFDVVHEVFRMVSLRTIEIKIKAVVAKIQMSNASATVS